MTDFLQNCFAGLALGSTYALIALGFVVIYKSTGVINFAQGGLLALGTYLGYTFSNTVAVAFGIAVVLACLTAAVVGASIERIVLRRMVGQPPFPVIMITVGLLFVLDPLITTVWGYDHKQLENPWNIRTVEAGGLILGVRELWTIGLTAGVVVAFFLFFRTDARRTELESCRGLGAGERVRRGGWSRWRRERRKRHLPSLR